MPYLPTRGFKHDRVPTKALSKLQVAQGHSGSWSARANEVARVARSAEIFFEIFRGTPLSAVNSHDFSVTRSLQLR